MSRSAHGKSRRLSRVDSWVRWRRELERARYDLRENDQLERGLLDGWTDPTDPVMRLSRHARRHKLARRATQPASVDRDPVKDLLDWISRNPWNPFAGAPPPLPG